MTPRRAMLLVIGLPLAAVLALWAWHAAEARRPAQQVALRTHVIRPGDTLYALAVRFYPTEDPRRVVYEMIQLNDVDPGHLRPGMVIVLPEVR